jgi:hypothetical protein
MMHGTILSIDAPLVDHELLNLAPNQDFTKLKIGACSSFFKGEGIQTKWLQVDIDGLQMSDLVLANNLNVKRGCTAYKHFPKGYIQAWSKVTTESNGFETLSPIITWEFTGFSKHTVESRLACCDFSPAYSPSKITFNFQSTNDQDREEEEYYLVGEPLIYNGNDWVKFDNADGRAVIWRITGRTPVAGCAQAEAYVIDLSVSTANFPGFTYLQSFYGKILDFYFDSRVLRMSLVFSQDRASLGRIGSINNRIATFDFAPSWTCLNSATFQIEHQSITQ